jgi:uncharacterized membrane protein
MVDQSSQTWTDRVNQGATWTLRNWLLFANGMVLIYGGVPWLSPIAHALGWHEIGSVIFLVYSFFCHQLPDRSFEFLGYQVAYCHRETAMYTTLFFGGLLYVPLRNYIKPQPMWVCGLLLLPMVLDGGSHLIGDLLRIDFRGDDHLGTFNFWMRMLTGVLFAFAVILTIYPRLDRDLRHIQAPNRTPV